MVAARGRPGAEFAAAVLLEERVPRLVALVRGRTVRLRETRGGPLALSSLSSLSDSESSASLSDVSEELPK